MPLSFRHDETQRRAGWSGSSSASYSLDRFLAQLAS